MSCATIKKGKEKKKEKNGHETHREDFGIVRHSLHPQLFKGLKTLVLIGVITN